MATDKGRIRLLELAEKGKEALKELGTNQNLSHRKGGRDHEFAKQRLAEEFRKKCWKLDEKYPPG